MEKGESLPGGRNSKDKDHKGRGYIMWSANDQETSVVRTVARTQKEGKEFARYQSHKAFGNRPKKTMVFTLNKMGRHEEFFHVRK